MLCILRHQGIQLILAYSWARPTTIAAVGVEGNVLTLNPLGYSPLWFEPHSGHVGKPSSAYGWSGGFPRILRFSSTFDERSA